MFVFHVNRVKAESNFNETFVLAVLNIIFFVYRKVFIFHLMLWKPIKIIPAKGEGNTMLHVPGHETWDTGHRIQDALPSAEPVACHTSKKEKKKNGGVKNEENPGEKKKCELAKEQRNPTPLQLVNSVATK